MNFRRPLAWVGATILTTIIATSINLFLPNIINKLELNTIKDNVAFVMNEEIYSPFNTNSQNEVSLNFDSKYDEVLDSINQDLRNQGYTAKIQKYIKKYYPYRVVFKNWKKHLLEPCQKYNNYITKKYLTIFYIFNNNNESVHIKNARISISNMTHNSCIFYEISSYPKKDKYNIKKDYNGILFNINDYLPPKEYITLYVFSDKTLDVNTKRGTYIEVMNSSKQNEIGVVSLKELIKKYQESKKDSYNVFVYFIISILSILLYKFIVTIQHPTTTGT